MVLEQRGHHARLYIVEAGWEEAGHVGGRGLEFGVPSLEAALRDKGRLVRERQWGLVRGLDIAVCGAAPCA